MIMARTVALTIAILKRLLIAAGVFVASSAAAQMAERMLFFPFDPREVSPADIGLPALTATRDTMQDGTEIVVWRAAPRAGKPVIFYLHGNAGNLAARKTRFSYFLRRGYGVIAPAYRGSSGSGGSPRQSALIADITTLLCAEKTAAPHAPLIIYGESIGAAVALQTMTESCAQNAATAVVLEAPFASIQALAEVHYPQIAALAPYLDTQFDSLSAVKSLRLPLFVLHGDRDALIPIEQGRAIFDAAPSPSREFLRLRGAGHTDLWRSDSLPRLWRFIDRHAVR